MLDLQQVDFSGWTPDSCLTGFWHEDPGQQRVPLEADVLDQLQVREARPHPLAQRVLRRRAPPAGLDLLHGGPARDFHHSFQPGRCRKIYRVKR